MCELKVGNVKTLKVITKEHNAIDKYALLEIKPEEIAIWSLDPSLVFMLRTTIPAEYFDDFSTKGYEQYIDISKIHEVLKDAKKKAKITIKNNTMQVEFANQISKINLKPEENKIKKEFIEKFDYEDSPIHILDTEIFYSYITVGRKFGDTIEIDYSGLHINSNFLDDEQAVVIGYMSDIEETDEIVLVSTEPMMLFARYASKLKTEKVKLKFKSDMPIFLKTKTKDDIKVEMTIAPKNE